MFGLVLTVLYSAWQYFIAGATIQAIWPVATGFLFNWYLVWAVIMAIVYFALTALISLGLGVGGADSWGPLGGLVGFIGGGALGIVVLGGILLLSNGAGLLGAFLLKGALVNGVWDTTRLIFGFASLVLGLFVGGRSSSSSSSSKS